MTPFLFLLVVLSGLWSLIYYTPLIWPEPATWLGVIRGLEPSFIPQDFLTNAIVQSPNESFAYLFVWICKAFHFTWWQGYLIGKVAVMLFLLPSLYLAVSRVIAEANTRVFQITFFIFAIFCLGGRMSLLFPLAFVFPLNMWLNPQSVSMLITAFAICLWTSPTRGARIGAGALFILAGVIHPVVNVCYVIFLLLIQTAFLIDEKRRKRESLWLPLVLSFMSCGTVDLIFSSREKLPLSELVDIYVYQRHAHHFDMPFILGHEWPRHLTLLIALVIPTVMAWFFRLRNCARAGALFIAAFLFFPLMQYLLVNRFPMRAIVLFGPTRFYLFSYWTVAVLWGAVLNSLWMKFAEEKPPVRTLRLGFYAGVSAALVIYASCLFVVWREPLTTLTSSEHEVIDWLQNNTSEQALIGSLRLPDSIFYQFDTLKIRIFARRSVVDDSVFPFFEPALREWSARWGNLQIDNGSLVHDSRFPIDFLVVFSSMKLNCAPVKVAAEYSIYAVHDCPVKPWLKTPDVHENLRNWHSPSS